MTKEEPDCHPDSLRAKGWSQGCQLRLPLPLRYMRIVADGQVRTVEDTHSQWMIADQDCDLAWRAILDRTDRPFLVELRPVFEDDPPQDWGIRSQRFRLDDAGHHLRASTPTVRATPDVVAVTECVGCLDADHQLRLKTWLGFRYDRPAVPQRYISLAEALAKQLSAKKQRAKAEQYRDVLAQFWDEDGEIRYSLVAVIPGGSFEPTSERVIAARTWLADAVRDVPPELGIAEQLDGYGDDDVTLGYIEGSYSLDLSRLSWPPNRPGPIGA